MQLKLLCGVACLLLLVIPVDLTGVSCVARDAVVGARTHFTCLFDKDINQTKKDFLIFKYPLSTTQPNITLNKKGEHVLSCNWGNNTSTPDCILESEKGYSFDYRISNTVFVDIASVHKTHEGVYRCQLVNEIIPTSNCSIRVITTTTTITENVAGDSQTAWTNATIASITINVVLICCGLLLVFRKRISRNFRTPLGGFRNQPGQTGINSPEDSLGDADIPLMDISRHVKYPKNARHKPTQICIDTIDKSIQVGNETGVTCGNKSTQLSDDAERAFFTRNLMVYKGDVVLTGSAERFRNPIYSTLGTPPVQLPPKYQDTEVSYKNSELNAHVKP